MTDETGHTAAGGTMVEAAAVRVADFAASEHFSRLFREGMDLVEETAGYLDGAGREDAKRLGRAGALAYAAESMTLTTQLMQAASWLLTQRAVSEGEMTPFEAASEKYRLGGTSRDKSEAMWPAGDDPCPPRLADLVTRSRSLHERLKRLDDNLFREGPGGAAPGENPLAGQWSALESAFAGRG
ncbi:DUF1465 family protein [Glycocaulis sp.]|uniref:protease adaptor protein RcdA n=1 Tax=Glycocaulis sp. TaxID=1969725 RepID=UPI0025BB2251|nr:DUF1465 family protein [Glycocaulis sp.]MCH8520812.1 DUF1465 family protein [Glycocaulis sp.]